VHGVELAAGVAGVVTAVSVAVAVRVAVGVSVPTLWVAVGVFVGVSLGTGVNVLHTSDGIYRATMEKVVEGIIVYPTVHASPDGSTDTLW
jgi:hypothetical protein